MVYIRQVQNEVSSSFMCPSMVSFWSIHCRRSRGENGWKNSFSYMLLQATIVAVIIITLPATFKMKLEWCRHKEYRERRGRFRCWRKPASSLLTDSRVPKLTWEVGCPSSIRMKSELTLTLCSPTAKIYLAKTPSLEIVGSLKVIFIFISKASLSLLLLMSILCTTVSLEKTLSLSLAQTMSSCQLSDLIVFLPHFANYAEMNWTHLNIYCLGTSTGRHINTHFWPSCWLC